jgi:hypothetical protein
VAQTVTAAVHIGVSVSPACRISVGDTVAASDDRRAAVRVACGRQNLQTLRVTSLRAGGIAPVRSWPGRNLHPDAEVVVVTLDF